MLRLLYFLSKTDTKVIMYCPSSTRNIHATMGFFVLMTGILALISGSYAISNMFVVENVNTGMPEMVSYGWFCSLLLGLIYASFIMAIDREIVSSGNKASVLLRIPLAIVISIVISLPIELKIFEGRITRQLNDEQKRDKDIWQEQARNKYGIPALESGLQTLNDGRQKSFQERARYADLMQKEVVGMVDEVTTGRAGKGPAYEEANRHYLMLDSTIKVFEADIKNRKQELEQARMAADSFYTIQYISQSYDLLSRYLALNRLKKVDETGAANRMGIGITLLFLLFELIPTLMKLFLPTTEHDAIIDNRLKLNVKATKSIFSSAVAEYVDRPDRIRDENPIVVQTIYEAQAL